MSIHVILLLIAILCFLLKGFGARTGSIDLWPIGWAFVILSLIVT